MHLRYAQRGSALPKKCRATKLLIYKTLRKATFHPYWKLQQIIQIVILFLHQTEILPALVTGTLKIILLLVKQLRYFSKALLVNS